MNKAAIQILLAEDDSNLGYLLEDYLSSEGFEVNLCSNGEQALQAFGAKQFDICLLDVMMPIMDGFTLAKEIRKQNQEIPIVFITAKSLKEDKLKGYEIGADDYILKPFDEEELKCKILALTRRTNSTKLHTNIVDVEIGSYLLSVNYQSLILNGVQKRLTEREFEILNYLYQHKNKIIKRDEMLIALWGENNYFYGRSLDVFITKIRKYLKDDPSITIENVFGVGFVFHCPH